MAAMPLLCIIQRTACLWLRSEKTSPKINPCCQPHLPLSPRAPAPAVGCTQARAAGTASWLRGVGISPASASPPRPAERADLSKRWSEGKAGLSALVNTKRAAEPDGVVSMSCRLPGEPAEYLVAAVFWKTFFIQKTTLLKPVLTVDLLRWRKDWLAATWQAQVPDPQQAGEELEAANVPPRCARMARPAGTHRIPLTLWVNGRAGWDSQNSPHAAGKTLQTPQQADAMRRGLAWPPPRPGTLRLCHHAEGRAAPASAPTSLATKTGVTRQPRGMLIHDEEPWVFPSDQSLELKNLWSPQMFQIAINPLRFASEQCCLGPSLVGPPLQYDWVKQGRVLMPTHGSTQSFHKRTVPILSPRQWALDLEQN